MRSKKATVFCIEVFTKEYILKTAPLCHTEQSRVKPCAPNVSCRVRYPTGSFDCRRRYTPPSAQDDNLLRFLKNMECRQGMARKNPTATSAPSAQPMAHAQLTPGKPIRGTSI